MNQQQHPDQQINPALVIQSLSRKLSQVNYENSLLEGQVQMLQSELAQLHEIMKSLSETPTEASSD